jgi:hypothetical protein
LIFGADAALALPGLAAAAFAPFLSAIAPTFNPFGFTTVPAGRAAFIRLAGGAGTVLVRTCWEVAGFRPRRAPRSR